MNEEIKNLFKEADKLYYLPTTEETKEFAKNLKEKCDNFDKEKGTFTYHPIFGVLD